MARIGRHGAALVAVVLVVALGAAACSGGSPDRLRTGAGADSAAPTTPPDTDTSSWTSDPTTTTTAPTPSTMAPASTTTVPTTPSTMAPAPPPVAPSPASAMLELAGTYDGTENFRIATGRCRDLDHSLDVTVDFGGEGTMTKHADYCGEVHGYLWTGAGTVTYWSPDGATLTGDFSDSAIVPSPGVPYDEHITGGTGRYAGASGTCHLDNHLEQIRFGQQRQFGTITCSLSIGSGAPASPSPALQ